MTPRAYGWLKDDHDDRDLLFAEVHHPHIAELPDRVDLRGKMPPVFDQGQLGSCTAQAIMGAFGFLHPGFIGSRLALYYAERLMEGTVDDDAGAQIRDGVKVLASQGVPPESEWPYNISKFREAPPARVVADGAAHKVLSYSRLTTEDDMRQCLAAGFPFVIGAEIWPEFESGEVARTGCVPLPNFDEDPLGGHAFDAVGYDRHSPLGDGFLCRNSWNDDWALGGYFWIPAGYLTHPDLASDAWTLRA